MATLIQQDLAALGMQVNVVTLDFPALIERLMHTQDYEACLLGLSNVDPDPNSMMNVWLSSSPNHQWNPSEKTPATPWEAEIDKQMQTAGHRLKDADRKRAVDRVQQIVADQQPFIYLVYPNTLYAVSPELTGVQPAVLSARPRLEHRHHPPAGRRDEPQAPPLLQRQPPGRLRQASASSTTSASTCSTASPRPRRHQRRRQEHAGARSARPAALARRQGHRRSHSSKARICSP